MDWPSFFAGAGAIVGIGASVLVAAKIADWRNERTHQQFYLRLNAQILSNQNDRFIRQITGTENPCYKEKRIRREFLEESEYWLLAEPANFPRHLRPILPKVQEQARQLKDIVNYLEKYSPARDVDCSSSG